MPTILLEGPDCTGLRLRTALSLSLATGQPFRMTNLRRRSRASGLRERDLAWLLPACEISGGSCEGAVVGSPEILFQPGKIRPGNHHFAIGGRSTSLLFQMLLPALSFADAPSTLRLEGNTHGRNSPPFDFTERVWLPAIRRAGVSASMRLLKTGFRRKGGGEIFAEVRPCGAFHPMVFDQRERRAIFKARVLFRHLDPSLGRKLLDALLARMTPQEALYENAGPGPCPGVCCMVEVICGEVREIISLPGGRAPYRIMRQLRNAARTWADCGAPVGRHLAHQLLVPMALAGPGSRILAMKPDHRVHIAIPIIEAFLPMKFEFTPAPRGCKVISVLPRALPM